MLRNVRMTHTVVITVHFRPTHSRMYYRFERAVPSTLSSNVSSYIVPPTLIANELSGKHAASTFKLEEEAHTINFILNRFTLLNPEKNKQPGSQKKLQTLMSSLANCTLNEI